MKEQLEAIRAGALAAIGAAGNTGELEALRVQYLGKKGELTAVLKQMGKFSAEERPVMGQLANAVRADVESAIAGAMATNTPKPGSVPGLSAEICESYPTGDGRLPTQHGRDKLPVPIPILSIPEQSISA